MIDETSTNDSPDGNQTDSRAGSPTVAAIWRPGWYELDQPVHVGQHAEFVFFTKSPIDVTADGDTDQSDDATTNRELTEAESLPLVFFNELPTDVSTIKHSATIVSLTHIELGPVNRIDTCGLDYIFVPADGAEVVVNAEEKPGKPVDPSITITDWTVKVTLADVSDSGVV